MSAEALEQQALERTRAARHFPPIVRIMTGYAALAGAVMVGAPPAIATPPWARYGVRVRVDKKTDFARFRTYSWTYGQSAVLEGIDRQIVACVDRELMMVGLLKVDHEPSDLLVRYGSVSRSDVNVKGKPTEPYGARPEYLVGTLLVILLEPGTQKEVFRGRADVPIESDPTSLGTMIDDVITRIFAKYPVHRGKGTSAT